MKTSQAAQSASANSSWGSRPTQRRARRRCPAAAATRRERRRVALVAREEEARARLGGPHPRPPRRSPRRCCSRAGCSCAARRRGRRRRRSRAPRARPPASPGRKRVEVDPPQHAEGCAADRRPADARAPGCPPNRRSGRRSDARARRASQFFSAVLEGRDVDVVAPDGQHVGMEPAEVAPVAVAGQEVGVQQVGPQVAPAGAAPRAARAGSAAAWARGRCVMSCTVTPGTGPGCTVSRWHSWPALGEPADPALGVDVAADGEEGQAHEALAGAAAARQAGPAGDRRCAGAGSRTRTGTEQRSEGF